MTLAAPAAVEPPAALPAGGLRVGFLGPLTGPASAYGLSCKAGIELALRDAAAAGGPRLELVVEDDGGDEVRAGAGAVRLAHEASVLAILGAVNSASTHVSARVAAMAGCSQITSVSTDPALTRVNNRWLFRNLSDDVLQGAALTRYLFDERGLRRVVLLHDDNRYGRGGARVVETEAAGRGRPLLLVREYPRGASDFSALAAEVAGAGPDGVVIWGLYGEAAGICKALAERGIRAIVAGGDGLASPAFIERAGAAAEGVIVTYPFDAGRPDSKTRGFVERFRAAYGREPDSFAAHSYDAAILVADAVRQAGADRTRVRQQLAASSRQGGVSGPGGFDATGNATSSVQLAVVENGKFKPLAPAAEVATPRADR